MERSRNKSMNSKKAFQYVAVCVIFTFTVFAIAGAFLRPDKTINANNQQIELARLAPLTSINFLSLKMQESQASTEWYKMLFLGGYGSSKPCIPSSYYVIKGGQLINYFVHPERLDTLIETRALNEFILAGSVPQQKATTFWLGTDKFGRDLLSRLMAGSCISLAVGLVAVLISLLGLTLGLLAGYFGGKTDAIIMWLVNVVWSVPTLLMVIAVTFALGKGFVQVFIAVGLTMWVEVARVVRGEAMRIKERTFIKSGLVLGYSHLRIILKHVLPNVWAPVIVISAANFATAILMEAGLSFLGVGTQVPMPSWGGIIRDHYALLTTSSSFLAIAPGICIMLLVFAFMLIGNWLRDSLDVKQA